MASQPVMPSQPPQPGALPFETACVRLSSSTSRARVDLPEPDTPVTTLRRPTGILASTLRRLCRRAPLISIMGVSASTARRPCSGCCSGLAR
ncbi:hypothetical protein D9M68_692480 [compost metagenome]